MNSNIRSALLNPASDMSTVFFAALGALKYDVENLSLDIQSVLLDVQDALGSPIPLTNQIKLATACKIAFTDLIYTDPAFFNEAAVVTETPTEPPSADTFEPAEIEDMAWLMVEAQLIDSAADEHPVESQQNYFMQREGAEPAKPAPQTYSESIWRLTGAALELAGASRPISALPQAIVSKVSVDENLDPNLYASLASRSAEIEQDVAKYVIDRLTILLGQLQKIPTADGEPLITQEMSNEWLSGLTAELLNEGT